MRAAILTVSTSRAANPAADESGPALADFARELGAEIAAAEVVPDERTLIAAELRRYCDANGCDLVLTTGGTIMTVDSEEEAITLANDSEFGLGASVWTLDRGKGERLARQLEAGMVWINDHSYTHGACQCAWGGVKESGLGRSHSKFGFYECVNIKTVSWEPSRLPDVWWQPYDEVLGKAISASARILYGKDGRRKQGLREGALPLLRVTGRSVRRALRGR